MRRPAAQNPEVYIPALPSTVVRSADAVPFDPASRTTLANPRQMGGDAVAEGAPERVAVSDVVDLAVVLDDHVPVREAVPDWVTVGDEVDMAVVLDDHVPV